jgi:hypothetical protein
MVHALEEIHRLLRPNGTLIEIHPALEAPSVIVRSDGTTPFVERDPAFDYEMDLRQAEVAVATVADCGLFVLEDDRHFDLMTHAASVSELRDHFAVTGEAHTIPRRRTRRWPGSRTRRTPGRRKHWRARPVWRS